MTETPPVLLTSADYCGTLAAARLLGRLGFRVTMAAPGLAGPASWSRQVARRVRCPPLSPPEGFVRWLVDFGTQNPGHLYYPTSDDLAWVTAAHLAELSPHFLLLTPPLPVLDRLLDKASLHALCAEVGIDTPRAWFPRQRADLERAAAEASYPVLVKQRTQVLSASHTKGILARTPDELLAQWEPFARLNPHDAAIGGSSPEACRPMIQEYRAEVADGTLIVAGFADRDGAVLGARAGLKLLQRPRRMGIALCLEETALDPALAAALGRLFRAAGYFGVFHVELIRSKGRLLLIDFNPRYYHHMAFEIARGLPLPLFVVAAAMGDRAALDRLAVEAMASSEPRGRVFAHWLDLRVMVAGQRFFGAMTPDEAARWWRWSQVHRGRTIDAVWDGADRWPTLFDVANRLQDWVRHPRSFVRRTLLNR
ncbi:MAG: carbamoyl-phosphate synthase [Deltaproteobacteria bacterium]|nr:carbamoyl-phosphate synthase [Deltaproteobacteria bacterium]